jgi:hypothetical protein
MWAESSKLNKKLGMTTQICIDGNQLRNIMSSIELIKL